MKKTRRLTYDSLLMAVALTIFMVEAQIPPVVPISGMKAGLSNIVTLYAMFAVGPLDALGILLGRIFLGSVFSGQMMSMIYSLSGGMLCYLVTLLLHRRMTKDQIWLCSIIGAMAHNIGQMVAAVAVTRTVGLVVYLPVLLLGGIVTGAFTGLCAQLLVRRGMPGNMKK